MRGAYLEKELLRAKQQGCPCPVFTRKADTDNEQSTTYLASRSQQKNLSLHRIHFSQLYGMSDNLAYNLAAAGYNASKYLPYGEVATALPYLIRRAEENTSIAGQMGREMSLLPQEIKRAQAVAPA